MTFPRLLAACRQDARLLLSALAVSTLAACATPSKPGTPPVPPPAAHGVTTLYDVPYGRADGRDLLLDLYLPATDGPGVNSARPRPVIVFFHGGGWRVGSKADAKGNVEKLVAQTGYALASVNYRLSQEAIFPAPILDGKTAVRWVRENASRFHLDPQRVGVMGFSSGGHLAAMLGVAANADSDRVQAVCDVSGPVDMNIPTDSIIGKLSVIGEFGGSAPSQPDRVRQADPSLYVRAGDPPFLIIQGAEDHLVIPAHAQKLYSALKAKGVEATLDVVPGAGHVPYGDEPQRTTRDFFVRHFGQP